jgi:hypothetical protein
LALDVMKLLVVEDASPTRVALMTLGYPCTQSSVHDRRPEVQRDDFFAAFILLPTEQQRLLDAYADERQRVLPELQQGPSVVWWPMPMPAFCS